MTLFNHSLHFSESLYGLDRLSYHRMAKNGGFEYYETRAHGCTMPGDIIQLDPDLKEEYPYILEHYRHIGLNCTDQVIWDLSAQVANDFPQHYFSVYLFVDEINAVRPDPKRLEATKLYVNKNSFMRFCQGKAPIPKTILSDAIKSPADYKKMAFPVYVKGALSATGRSVYRCTTPEQVEEAIAQMGGEYQLQEGVPAVSSLSVVYEVTPKGAVTHMMNSEQIIDGVEYAGTRYPTAYSPQLVTQAIAQQAARDGLCGKIGFDVAVTADGKYFVLECNPRWTGAVYPMVVAKRLGASEWASVHLPVRAEHLKDIVLGDLQYDPARGTGVVLVNWGGIRYHWLELLLIGPKDVQRTLQAKLVNIL